jgi:hypothetical protein
MTSIPKRDRWSGTARVQRPLPARSLRARLLLAIAVGALGAGLSVPAVQAACCYFAAKDKDINQPGQKAFIT